jgi:hypothetical protein
MDVEHGIAAAPFQVPILTSLAAQKTPRLNVGGASRRSATTVPPDRIGLCSRCAWRLREPGRPLAVSRASYASCNGHGKFQQDYSGTARLAARERGETAIDSCDAGLLRIESPLHRQAPESRRRPHLRQWRTDVGTRLEPAAISSGKRA